MNLQPAYASGLAAGVPGQILNSENTNRISRTVESAAGLAFGQPAFRGAGDHGVVNGAALTATSVSSVDAGNVGSGTITATPAIAAPGMAGRYTVEMLATGAAGAFNLIAPDGSIVDDGVAGTAKTAGGVGPFTIGGTPTIADRFYIDVTYTVDAKYLGLAILNDAVQTAAAGATVDAYPQYASAALLTEGGMWVTAGGTVVQGGPVYWDPATSRYSSDATKVRIPNARFDAGASNGGIVPVMLRLRDG